MSNKPEQTVHSAARTLPLVHYTELSDESLVALLVVGVWDSFVLCSEVSHWGSGVV